MVVLTGTRKRKTRKPSKAYAVVLETVHSSNFPTIQAPRELSGLGIKLLGTILILHEVCTRTPGATTRSSPADAKLKHEAGERSNAGNHIELKPASLENRSGPVNRPAELLYFSPLPSTVYTCSHAHTVGTS